MNAVAHKRASGSVITAETYGYGAGGNLTFKVVDGVRTDYGYDAVDQLTSESTPGSALSYTCDAAGNRLTKVVNGNTETYAYDGGDKLLTRNGPFGNFTYGYDACGRTTSVQSPGGTTTLAYDYEDRMTGIQGPGGSATYAYNGADARVSKVASNGSRTYRRDGVGPTAPVLSDGTATMVPGISERTAGVTKFSHLDRLGTNAKTTDPSGTVVDSRSYDAFGLPVSVVNPTGSQQGFAGAFGYQEDAESGLKLLGHRYYDSATGRFITRDPIGSGTNWYRYCDNNPLADVDPTGYQAKKDIDGPSHHKKKHQKSKPKGSASDALLKAGIAVGLAALGVATVAGEGTAAFAEIMFAAGSEGGVESGKGKPKKDPDAWKSPEYIKQEKFRKGLEAVSPKPGPDYDAHHVIEQQFAGIVERDFGPEGTSFMEDPVRNAVWWANHHHQRYAQLYHDELLRRYNALEPRTMQEFYEIGLELTREFQKLP